MANSKARHRMGGDSSVRPLWFVRKTRIKFARWQWRYVGEYEETEKRWRSTPLRNLPLPIDYQSVPTDSMGPRHETRWVPWLGLPSSRLICLRSDPLHHSIFQPGNRFSSSAARCGRSPEQPPSWRRSSWRRSRSWRRSHPSPTGRSDRTPSGPTCPAVWRTAPGPLNKGAPRVHETLGACREAGRGTLEMAAEATAVIEEVGLDRAAAVPRRRGGQGSPKRILWIRNKDARSAQGCSVVIRNS